MTFRLSFGRMIETIRLCLQVTSLLSSNVPMFPLFGFETKTREIYLDDRTRWFVKKRMSMYENKIRYDGSILLVKQV